MRRESVLRRCGIAIVAVLIGATPGTAQEPPKLSFPLDCVVGETCWVVHYFDHDPGPGAKDYACGSLIYDGHDAIDIAIRDLAVMREGVEVRAAAAGTVIGTRDGMQDVSVREIGADKVKDRECGNGVNVDIGDGWFVQYCHMRRSSIAVKTGDGIEAGQVLGMVGLSGNTEFPHLHIGVRNGKQKIDPFVGLETWRNCMAGAAPLWDEAALSAMTYRPVAIYNAGLAERAPKWDEVREGQHRQATLSSDAGALVLWTEIYGVIAGDRLTMRIVGPDGNIIVDKERNFEKTQIRRFEYVGKPAEGAWPSGRYTGEIVVLHHGVDGNVEFRHTTETVVP
jgi:hypothetical protein